MKIFQQSIESLKKKNAKMLFYGNSAASKSKAINQIAKQNNQDIHKIKVSEILSKSIEETEKNLAKLFAAAESKGWILFFDEADELFSKRTSVKDAHDKYANQEIAYLLQRLEAYNGTIIFNCKECNKTDKAVTKYFHSIIHFPKKDKNSN